MGPVLFYGIGAARPRVHVKGAVFLFGPSVIVFEGGVVFIREVGIDFGEKGAGVVGAVNRPVVAGQRPVELFVHKGAQPGINARAIALLGVSKYLLVVGGKEKGPVLYQRPAHSEAELPLAKIWRALHALVPRGARQGVVFAEKMH